MSTNLDNVRLTASIFTLESILLLTMPWCQNLYGGFSVCSITSSFLYWGYTSVLSVAGGTFSARRLLLPQGGQCSGEFVTPLWTCVLQGGVHGIDGFLPGNVSAVYLRDFGVGAYLIVADALFLIILPVAGGHGGGVISTKAADIHIDGATTCTGYVARVNKNSSVAEP